MKGKSNEDPFRFEGRRKKEGEREGVAVEQILLAKSYYQDKIDKTKQYIRQFNPGVTSVDDALLKKTKIKDFRTLNDRFSSGTGLVVTFKCGTQWNVGASRPMTHCKDSGCVHEQQEPRVPRIENKKIDPTINEAKINPGRNIKTEMKCYDCDQHLYRRVEAVKQADGTFKDYLYNICLADGQKGFRKPV